MILDWNHVYLLGWNDETGKSHLSSWTGDQKVHDFVVIGATDGRPPLWGQMPNNPETRLEAMPEGLSHEQQLAHAKARGGLRAFGWYYEEGFDLKQDGVNMWGQPRIVVVRRP